MERLNEMKEVWSKVNEKLAGHKLPEITPVFEDNGEEVCGGLASLLLLFRDKEGWFLCRNKDGDPDKQIILAVLISSLLGELTVGTKYHIEGDVLVWDTPQ